MLCYMMASLKLKVGFADLTQIFCIGYRISIKIFIQHVDHPNAEITINY